MNFHILDALQTDACNICRLWWKERKSYKYSLVRQDNYLINESSITINWNHYSIVLKRGKTTYNDFAKMLLRTNPMPLSDCLQVRNNVTLLFKCNYLFFLYQMQEDKYKTIYICIYQYRKVKQYTSLNLKSNGHRSFSKVASFCRDLSSFWRPLTFEFLNLFLKQK